MFLTDQSARKSIFGEGRSRYLVGQDDRIPDTDESGLQYFGIERQFATKTRAAPILPSYPGSFLNRSSISSRDPFTPTG